MDGARAGLQSVSESNCCFDACGQTLNVGGRRTAFGAGSAWPPSSACSGPNPVYHRAMDLLKPLIALLAIVNPIGVIPFFIHFTHGFNRDQRQHTIRLAAFSAFVVIAVSKAATRSRALRPTARPLS